MTTIAFSTKAETLEALSRHVSKSRVLPQIRFTVSQYQSDPSAVLQQIQQSFSGTVIVRSSALSEDMHTSSNAGKYTSVLNVASQDSDCLDAAIIEVVNSFEGSTDNDEVFVQPQMLEVSLSGVLFTRDLQTDAPYYVINYDDSTKSTESVTSGEGGTKTFVLYRLHECHAPLFDKLIAAAKEIEELFASDRLDIEFAIDHDGYVYIFQVRPLATAAGPSSERNDQLVGEYLDKVAKKIAKLANPHPYLEGDTSYFGVMPDWNPAEIIGVHPKRLALSLYKELVTDRVWAYQRRNYGYKDVRSFPLIVSFLGIPYIDVRTCFNSFIPATLSSRIARKLIEYYLNRLSRLPHLHDKVEFDIVFSCYFFDLSKRLEVLQEYGFSEDEVQSLESSLLSLTNQILSQHRGGLLYDDINKIQELSRRFDIISHSECSVIDTIYWLTEDCKRYGTLPFAGIARSAFVAMQLLNSLVDVGVLTSERREEFLHSLGTVSLEMQRDLAAYHSGDLSKEAFLKRYGHLRPGTYEITSKRYDEAFEDYFSSPMPASVHSGGTNERRFQLTSEEQRQIDNLLVKEQIECDACGLFEFFKSAVVERENAKFIFTRNLSLILKLITQMGERFGFTPEDLAHLDFSLISSLHSLLEHFDLKVILAENIERNRQCYSVTSKFLLPHLILNADDIYSFSVSEGQPNFISLGEVEDQVILEEAIHSSNGKGIVFIRSADPGYDWLFSYPLSGLITMYGGCNSHMAIRCAELGLPAVIGAGEHNFKRWSASSRIRIDCTNHTVTVIQ